MYVRGYTYIWKYVFICTYVCMHLTIIDALEKLIKYNEIVGLH